MKVRAPDFAPDIFEPIGALYSLHLFACNWPNILRCKVKLHSSANCRGSGLSPAKLSHSLPLYTSSYGCRPTIYPLRVDSTSKQQRERALEPYCIYLPEMLSIVSFEQESSSQCWFYWNWTCAARTVIADTIRIQKSQFFFLNSGICQSYQQDQISYKMVKNPLQADKSWTDELCTGALQGVGQTWGPLAVMTW
jgi:hypothetical protein